MQNFEINTLNTLIHITIQYTNAYIYCFIIHLLLLMKSIVNYRQYRNTLTCD